MYFAKNIKLLRKRLGRTQDDVAVALTMKRSTLSGYENLVSEPSLTALIALSNYYNVAIDTLVKVDLLNLTEQQLRQLSGGFDVELKGANYRVLVATVDSRNRDNIELVPEKAKAGYSTGYADPEFIVELPVFQLPFLSSNKKYRTFQISGDSMLPIPSGAYVTGEFLTNWNEIKSGEAYLFVTIDDGIVFKIAEKQSDSIKFIKLCSLNPLFDPFEVSADKIKEIWKFVHYISPELPEPVTDVSHLVSGFKQLRNEVLVLRKSIEFKKD